MRGVHICGIYIYVRDVRAAIICGLWSGDWRLIWAGYRTRRHVRAKRIYEWRQHLTCTNTIPRHRGMTVTADARYGRRSKIPRHHGMAVTADTRYGRRSKIPRHLGMAVTADTLWTSL